MKKPLLIFLILICVSKLSLAQDFPYGSISRDELDMKTYAKDTSAHAVILQEHGSARINIGGDDRIKVMYEYHVKIKIFDTRAFDKGTVEIMAYNNSDNDSYEDVSDIKGVTYYIDDNGLSKKVELENKKIYPVKENKHWANYKFALPGIKKGCVIEYSYKIESPYWEDFHPWAFQSDIPKKYSDYEVHIPAFWTYNASLKGYLKLTKNTQEVETKCFETHGASCDCSFITYGIADIPAFIEDDYMTSSKNFMSAINFELVEYTSPYDGAKHRMTKDWKDIDYTLRTDSYFGGQLKRKGLLKDRVAAIVAGKTNDLDKAKAIYAYWQKWFKWNNFTGISSESISKAIDTHSGSVADINLSLVTALADAGLSSEAVLLSTRENGDINTLYPVINDFNYVIAKVNIGDQSYMLDATGPMLPFGVLPLKCLNDKGRVFNLDKPSYFIDMNLPQREKSTYAFDLTLQEDGKLKGTYTHFSMGYEAYIKRLAIKKFNSTDEYVEDLNSKLPKWKFLKYEIRNVDSLDLPIAEKYDIEIDLFSNMADKNRLSFSPYIIDKYLSNPFKLAERSFPIDLGMPEDRRCSLTIHLPAQYAVESYPEPAAFAIPNSGGKYMCNYTADTDSFNFTYLTQLNKPVYSADEYPYLKELYNKIVQAEKGEIVLKKK
jgi:hypothetical protein